MAENAENHKENQEEKSVPKSEFIDRVSEFGPVKGTWGLAAGAYAKVKTYNGMIKYTLDTAENTAFLAAEKVKPVVARLEKPIHFVDTYACKGLDKIENTVESTQNNPKVIAATALIQGTIESAVRTIDGYVDQYLPPEEDEKQNGTINTPDGTFYRALYVSNKLQTRLLRKTKQTITNMSFTIDAIQFFKDVKASGTANLEKVQVRLAEIREKSIKLWYELSSDEPPADDETRTLAIARLLAVRIKKVYTAIPTIPPVFSIASNYTIELYSSIAKKTHLDDVSNAVLAQVRDRLKQVQGLLVSDKSAQ